VSEAWRIEETFGLSQLARVEHDPGAPGPGRARVKLEAWSLNYRDYLVVTGGYNPRQPLPLIPLSDAVGEEIGRAHV